jgi:hypothetical protein
MGTRVGGIPEVLTGPMAKFLTGKDEIAALKKMILFYKDWRNQEPMIGDNCRLFATQKFGAVAMLNRLTSALNLC